MSLALMQRMISIRSPNAWSIRIVISSANPGDQGARSGAARQAVGWLGIPHDFLFSLAPEPFLDSSMNLWKAGSIRNGCYLAFLAFKQGPSSDSSTTQSSLSPGFNPKISAKARGIVVLSEGEVGVFGGTRDDTSLTVSGACGSRCRWQSRPRSSGGST